MGTRHVGGSIALLASAGMLLASIGQTLSTMNGWEAALHPAFAGQIFVQIGAAVASYVAGQMLPTSSKLVPDKASADKPPAA